MTATAALKIAVSSHQCVFSGFIKQRWDCGGECNLCTYAGNINGPECQRRDGTEWREAAQYVTVLDISHRLQREDGCTRFETRRACRSDLNLEQFGVVRECTCFLYQARVKWRRRQREGGSWRLARLKFKLVKCLQMPCV